MAILKITGALISLLITQQGINLEFSHCTWQLTIDQGSPLYISNLGMSQNDDLLWGTQLVGLPELYGKFVQVSPGSFVYIGDRIAVNHGMGLLVGRPLLCILITSKVPVL
jgi:hypothetical protein